VKARVWWSELAKGELNVSGLSKREGISDSYVSRALRLAFLSPEVVEAILAGKLRAEVDGLSLLQADAVPGDWDEQRGRFLPSQ